MYHTPAQQSTPASIEQIAEALQILFNSMPFPRGADPEKAVYGYMQALQGYPIDAIATGIRKFLRGECGEVSPKFCPHPPELAAIIRSAIPSRPTTPTGKAYGYKTPKSRIVERKLTRDYARQLVDNGVHPRGCIWLPGDPEGRRDLGDLYGPDPEWKSPRPLGEPVET